MISPMTMRRRATGNKNGEERGEALERRCDVKGRGSIVLDHHDTSGRSRSAARYLSTSEVELYVASAKARRG